MNTPNSKYKAVFEVPAMVRITIDLEAPEQQAALVQAHDAILCARPEQAEVLSLVLDQAVNTGLERTFVAPAASAVAAATPPSPLALAGRSFTLCRYSGRSRVDSELVEALHKLDYEQARQMAEDSLQPTSRYGSAIVLDALGNVVLRVEAPRGGWEVIVTPAGAAGQPDVIHSWLGSRAEANRLCVEQFKAGARRVCIWDFTSREAGPVLRRECL